MTPKTERVLTALRSHVEGVSTDIGTGAAWGCVYLDNALADLKPMSRRSFAGHLSRLTEAKVYKSLGDDCFGEVLL